MKKLLVLFVAVAATITLAAKETQILFNRAQFQWSVNSGEFIAKVNENPNYNLQLTVPFVYKGTVTLNADWVMEPPMDTLTLTERSVAACLISKKASYPAVMTICQPCIDCYPCDVLDAEALNVPKTQIYSADPDESKVGVPYTGVKNDLNHGEPGWITVWNLYLVTKVNKKKDDKRVEVAKIDLLAGANPGLFFTGAKGKNVYLKYADAGVNLQLTGAKNDYKFKFYKSYLRADQGTGLNTVWNQVETKKQETAYIMSPKALNGTILYNFLADYTADTTADQVQVLDVAGTVKLTRDASWTDKAIKGAFGVEKAADPKNWDCIDIPVAATCEQYFAADFDNAYWGASYKNYEYDPTEYDSAEFFAAAYDPEDNFKYMKEEEEGDE